MTARWMGPNHKKDKGEFGKFKTGGREELKKNQYAFCRKEGHWKIDCPKIKPKKKESKPEANIAQTHGNDSNSSGYSLSITPIGCCTAKSECILDTMLPIVFIPNGSGFANF